MQAASASHPQKARRRRYFGLQARFIVSYLFAVLLPILLMSIFLYRYHTDQMDSNYLLEKQNSLAMEQLAAEELLTSPVRYYNQLRTNYELSSMLRGVYSTEREVVYAYNSAVYSSLNNLIYYDPSLDNICVYAKEPISSRILKRFFPLWITTVITRRLIPGLPSVTGIRNRERPGFPIISASRHLRVPDSRLCFAFPLTMKFSGRSSRRTARLPASTLTTRLSCFPGKTRTVLP